MKPPRLVVGTDWCEQRHCQIPFIYENETLQCYGYNWPETHGGSMIYVPVEEVSDLVEQKNKIIDKLMAELKSLKNA